MKDNFLYIFIDSLVAQSFSCVCLDKTGAVVTPLSFLTLTELKRMQQKTHTVVVLSTAEASLHQVPLALVNDKKVRQALPYALEDKLAAASAEMHFAFAKQFYTANKYLVVVISKAYLDALLSFLTANTLIVDVITIDFFAVSPNEFVFVGHGGIINKPDNFQGFLPGQLALDYLSKNEENTHLFSLERSTLAANKRAKASLDVTHSWLAQRLQAVKPINLLQGIYSPASSSKKNYYLTLFSVLFFTAAWLVSTSVSIYKTNKKIRDTDSKIAQIYHHFFPNAAQVISPKFRVQQLLKSQGPTSKSTLWTLLAAFTKSVDLQHSTINEIQFAQQKLTVVFTSSSFDAIQVLQKKLQQERIIVKQAQVSSAEHTIKSTFELSL